MSQLRTNLPKACCCGGRICDGTIRIRPFFEFAVHITRGCERVYANEVECIRWFIFDADRETQAAAYNEARGARHEDHLSAARQGAKK